MSQLRGPRDTVVILNRPRLTFTAHSHCVERVLHDLVAAGIVGGIVTQSGVFWEQCMQRAVLQALDRERQGAIGPIDFFLFTDFDTVFEVEQVLRLREIITADATIDAVYPVQAARHWDQPLLFDPRRNYVDATTDTPLGHFGCTMIRRSVFALDREPNRRAARLPWFWSLPNAKGLWDEGRVDPDIYFWNSLRNNGGRIVQANEVIVGHLELAVMWPEMQRRPVPGPDGVAPGRSVDPGDDALSTGASCSTTSPPISHTTRWQRLVDYEREGRPTDLHALHRSEGRDVKSAASTAHDRAPT